MMHYKPQSLFGTETGGEVGEDTSALAVLFQDLWFFLLLSDVTTTKRG